MAINTLVDLINLLGKPQFMDPNTSAGMCNLFPTPTSPTSKQQSADTCRGCADRRRAARIARHGSVAWVGLRPPELPQDQPRARHRDGGVLLATQKPP